MSKSKRKSKKSCKGLVSAGAKIHASIFRTLARRACKKRCEAHLHLADKKLDMAVRNMKRGVCFAAKRVVKEARKQVAAARRARG